MRATPHLHFDGRCEAAFRAYQQCFGATSVSFVRYRESPMASGVSDEWQDKVLHATLQAGDLLLMGGDVPAGGYEAPRGFAVLLGVDEPDEADRIFAALAEGGIVQTPLQETFWARRFGTVTDRFGIPWEINC